MYANYIRNLLTYYVGQFLRTSYRVINQNKKIDKKSSCPSFKVVDFSETLVSSKVKINVTKSHYSLPNYKGILLPFVTTVGVEYLLLCGFSIEVGNYCGKFCSVSGFV